MMTMMSCSATQERPIVSAKSVLFDADEEHLMRQNRLELKICSY